MASPEPLNLSIAKHASSCSSIIPRSQFDSSCPYCATVQKVVHLRRRTVANGATPNEALIAESLAQRLIAKYAVPIAWLKDRLYTSPTQSPAAQAERAHRRATRRGSTKRYSTYEEEEF